MEIKTNVLADMIMEITEDKNAVNSIYICGVDLVLNVMKDLGMTIRGDFIDISRPAVCDDMYIARKIVVLTMTIHRIAENGVLDHS